MPLGPADPDATARWLRDVGGLDDEGLAELDERAAAKKARKEAEASNANAKPKQKPKPKPNP